MIWIRADGGHKIGMGHIMRCMAVADELWERGKEVCFILADEAPAALLESRGHQYIVLDTDYSRMEDELEELLAVMSRERPGPLLVDSYFITEHYISRLREYVPVIYLDDMCRLRYPVDMLINYNIFASRELYAPEVCGEDCNMLLGPSFAPLRSEFAGWYYEVRDQVRSVLLTTGGSDPLGLAGQLLEKLLQTPACSRFDYYVVSGMYNERLSELRELEKRHGNVHIRVNESNMAELMQRCDAAITAGGSTLYELSAIGVPTACFSFVDNQERIVQGYGERELVCFSGNYLTQGAEMLEGVAKALERLAADRDVRIRYSTGMRKLVDGQGAGRIADKILEELEVQ